MANGTIAFDTLTTSDSANTNTEKSIDTSYIFNGVAKFWVHFNGTGTIATQDSFNQSALTDNGTGEYTSTFSNNMANDDYSTQVTGTESGDDGVSSQIGTLQRNGDYSTSQVESNGYHANNNADADNHRMMVNVLGDLA